MHRIAFLIDALGGGGAERFVVDLAIELHRAGHEVAVVVTRYPGLWADELKKQGVDVLSARRKNRYDLIGWIRCIRLLRRFRPHVVHAHKTWGNITGALLSFLLRFPLIVHEHSNPYQDGKTVRFLKKWLYAKAHRIFACDSDTMCRLKYTIGVDTQKFRVIPNGIPLDNFGFGSDTTLIQRIRKELWGDSSVLIGTFARLEPQKNVDVLLDALLIAREKETNIKCIIAGTGSLSRHLERRVQKEKLFDLVKMLGFRKDVRKLLCALDIFVLSSDWEGLPVALLEAMFAGKAVVVTDVGGVRDAVIHGENGILIPPRDPQALAEALIALSRDAAYRQRLGAKAMETVRDRFTIPQVARMVLEEYHKVLISS